ncbi:MAG: hypothetical protein PWQ37_1487 [Candidatus Petromonas sp.]|jgi:hypothetical protein|nr:hypothetical protein [Candidatus Petromonas sp.]
MFYYEFKGKALISYNEYEDLNPVPEEKIKESDQIYVLKRLEPSKSRRSFSVSDPSLMFLEREGLNLLQRQRGFEDRLPKWLISKIELRKVTCINTEYPNWQEALEHSFQKKWRVNVFGLGDVGGTLTIGLRLLGGDCICEIGIYDRRDNKKMRWVYETNQILSTLDNVEHPLVRGIEKEELFDCDMFVFCASIGVPPVGEKTKDVRMVQFEGNSELIGTYARMARNCGFKGIFAVVSDPVDLLCKSVLIQSNIDEKGKIDYRGLAPEQIRGYGLGVMNARAAYYAVQNKETMQYLKDGRAYGPHGEGLVIADSIENYNDDISRYLTNKTKKANLDVRETGFKPFIAPALSSGSLSIIATIKGEWHYSATFMGGVYMGARNRLTSSGIEIERLDLPDELIGRLEKTYKELEKIL